MIKKLSKSLREYKKESILTVVCMVVEAAMDRNNKLKLEVSIDEPLNVDWDGNELLLSDILGTDENVISKDMEDEVDKKLLRMALSKLNKRERTIIELRFGINSADGEEKTQKEVADMMGISQSYISRLEKKIIRRLKKEIVRME